MLISPLHSESETGEVVVHFEVAYDSETSSEGLAAQVSQTFVDVVFGTNDGTIELGGVDVTVDKDSVVLVVETEDGPVEGKMRAQVQNPSLQKSNVLELPLYYESS